MAKSVTVNGATFADVPSVLLPLASGDGYAKFIEEDEGGGGGNYFDFSGTNATLLKELTQEWTLADTSFPIGTGSSTSATSIKAATTNLFKDDTRNYGDNDLIVVQTIEIEPTYSSSATNKFRSVKYHAMSMSQMIRRKNILASSKYRDILTITSNKFIYYNTNSVLVEAGSQYGIYATLQSAAINSTSADSTYVRCSSPALYYRCSNSYHTAANNQAITACTFKWNIKLYSLDKRSTAAGHMYSTQDEFFGITF